MFSKKAFLVAAVVIGASQAQASANLCKTLFSGREQNAFTSAPTEFKGPTGDLLLARSNEIKNLAADDVRKANLKDVAAFSRYEPEVRPSLSLGRAITIDQFERLFEVMKADDVVGNEGSARYNHDEVEIGYCFGRATYVHIMLKKMGVQDDSIRKVWMIGPMTNLDGAKSWCWHVADAAYVEGYGWRVIDKHTFKTQSVEHWYRHFAGQSLDGKTRFYVTDPTRFTPTIESYDRIQMGYDLSPERDWFKNYFPHMSSSISKLDLSDVGLRRVRPTGVDVESAPAKRNDPKPNPVFKSLKSFFWVD